MIDFRTLLTSPLARMIMKSTTYRPVLGTALADSRFRWRKRRYRK
jgi:hypothetical protein